MNNQFIDPIEIQSIKVAVDSVCIATEDNEDYVLLIRREYEPFKDSWALPGGFLQQGEELEDGAIRELKEETNIDGHLDRTQLVQIGAYGAKNRDPRPRRVISIAYLIRLNKRSGVRTANESLEVKWINIKDLKNIKLAFDHSEIINDALNIK